MTTATFFFFLLALVAVASALGMLLSRNSVYAALFLIVNFGTVAVIYLTLGAPFIALAQVTVYAGAIMVLFLFVIMLLGAEKLQFSDRLPWQRPLGIVLGAALLLEAGYVIVVRSGVSAPLVIPSADFASPQAIGMELFSGYLLPFEVTSILLLVAMVGAIVLTRGEKPAAGRRLMAAQPKTASRPDGEQKPGTARKEDSALETERAGAAVKPGPRGS